MSSRYVYGDDDRLVSWAEKRLDNCRFRDDAKAIGHEFNGEIVAVVVFDTFSPGSCVVAVASDGRRRWFTREFATRCFAYPFVQCGMRHISAFVSIDNTASMRFSPKLGWVQEGRLRQAGARGEDLILFGMLREECPWLAPSLRVTGKLPG